MVWWRLDFRYPSLALNDRDFTHNDGHTVHLLATDGTIPIHYQSVKYNIPIVMWLVENYPRSPPICYVNPTPDMVVKPKHPFVNGSGLIWVRATHTHTVSERERERARNRHGHAGVALRLRNEAKGLTASFAAGEMRAGAVPGGVERVQHVVDAGGRHLVRVQPRATAVRSPPKP